MKKLIKGRWLYLFFPEISLKMKLTTLLLLVSLLQINASTYSQNTKISLNVINATVGEIFNEIESTTEFRFLFESNQIDLNRIVSLDVDKKKISYILDLLFKETPVVYNTNDRQIILTIDKSKTIENSKKKDTDTSKKEQQAIKISGTVKDNNNAPLPGVNILVKGSSIGTQTDFDGNYEIEVQDENTILVFSFLGFLTQEITVSKSSTINIILKEDVAKLNEIVVVGYGSQRQKDLTGAVSSMKSENFNKGPQLSAQQAMQGKMAGVVIAQNSGKPGGSNTVRVRGGTSITGVNDPLYVIDGVPISTTAGVSSANIRSNGTDFFDQEPTNPLMTINPNDIESITVLKDASSTAIYGSRGANGVIVITTKKGSSGNLKVTLDVTGGISTVANKLDVLTADEYRKVNTDLGLTFSDLGGNTNWQDQIYRTAQTQDYNLSFSGGSGKSNYRASLGYGNQEGVLIGSQLERSNARININHSALDDKLTFDLRLNYGNTFSNNSPVSNTVGSEAGTSINYESYVFNPTYPIFDADGNYNHVPPYRVNPVSFANDVIDEVTNNRFLGNLSTTYKIIDPLSININLGYTNQTINRNSYINKTNPLGEGMGGYASVQKLQDYSKLLETILRFNKTYGKHSIDALAGYSWQYFVNEGLRNTASGFLSDEFKWYSLQAASTISNVSTFKGSNTLISMYGRANYNFDDKILATATVRRDGSSRFGSGNQWGIFPSGSLAWRVSNMDFFKSNTISDLKIRMSYGVTGNQEIGNLNSVTTLGATNAGYIVGGQRVTTVLPQQYANPDLKWEQTSQFNIGVDYTILDNRIRGSIDYYRKKTTDLLLRLPVPSPTAVSTQLANVGSVENKGIELEISADIIDKNDFTWTSSFNYSRNRNKVLSLSNDQYQGDNIQVAPLQGQGLSGIYAQLIKPGLAVGTFYGREFIGIENGEEIIDNEEKVIGSAQPDFTFGFSNSLTYKNVSLGFNFRGSIGNDVFNLTGNNLGYLSNLPGRNVFKEALTSGVLRSQPKQYSSRWIEDGSFVRLDNVTLGYNFDLKTTSALSSARIFITGQNLLLFTNYSGLDPEVNSDVSGTGIAPLGVDYLAYPKAKTVSLGLNVSF
ncbi:TonB-dependent receptor [Thalassobellus suaedae]|uniref:TonB-dependent receptor n=1 Tax=Thalassobellus suaedae TaxID=3074124 RepID=A0ABY9XZ40_9FLAO|nr:TonB-dependent receptor [Flavobacteriaceae bacterium HL-DH10]